MGHCCKDVPWGPSKSLIHIEYPLLEIVLSCELHLPLVVPTKLAIKVQGWPALYVPVLMIHEVYGYLPFCWCKVILLLETIKNIY